MMTLAASVREDSKKAFDIADGQKDRVSKVAGAIGNVISDAEKNLETAKNNRDRASDLAVKSEDLIKNLERFNLFETGKSTTGS